MLFLNNAYNYIGNKRAKDFHYHSIEQIPSYNYQQIHIEFVDGKYEIVRQIIQRTGKENTLFSFRSPYRYNSNLKVKESKAAPEIRLNSYGASVSADIDDKMEET